MSKVRKADLLEAFARDAETIRGVVNAETLGDPVQPCPGWDLHRLIGHLAHVYRWAATALRQAGTERPTREKDPVPEGMAVLELFDDSYADVRDALVHTPEDKPTWNWAPRHKTAVFWPRRMAHETAVHRWDAQITVGITEPIGPPAFAADGIAEVLDTWLPAGKRKGPTNVAGLVHLVATDAEAEWFVRLRGEGLALLDTHTVVPEEHPAQARAVGTASDVLLALYGRVSFDALDLAGDEVLLSALRTG